MFGIKLFCVPVFMFLLVKTAVSQREIIEDAIESLPPLPEHSPTTSSPVLPKNGTAILKENVPNVFPNEEDLKGTKTIICDAAEMDNLRHHNSTHINTTVPNSDNGSDAPSEFPSPNNSTKTICDLSVVDNLVHHTSNTTKDDKVDSEVTDLLKNDQLKKEKAEQKNSTSAEVKTTNSFQPIDTETELIENGENTEDKIKLKHMESVQNATDGYGPGVHLVQGQLAAILAAVFVSISIVAYAALLSWRRFLEHRYGNREMLVNDDDFNSDDLRNFSI